MKLRRPAGLQIARHLRPLNGAANPDAEIWTLNLAAILGYDSVFRPTARYQLGPKASAALETLIKHTPIQARIRPGREQREHS